MWHWTGVYLTGVCVPHFCLRSLLVGSNVTALPVTTDLELNPSGSTS
jgi:hypothetical protein